MASKNATPQIRLGLDDIPVPILGLNEHEQLIVANKEARDRLRLEGDAWRGQPIQALLNFNCNLSDEFGNAVSGVHSHRLRIPNDHGTAEWVALVVQRKTGDDALRYTCVLVSDNGVHAAESELGEQLAAMGQMIAGFAHEVRNPLAALRSIIEDLLATPNIPADAQKDVERLQRLVIRIERLVRGSLLLVRSERANPREHRVGSLVSSALDVLESRLRTTNESSISVDNAAPRATVVVDENQLVQVLVILLENALDAVGSPERVRIRIRASMPEPDSNEKSTPSRHIVVVDVEDDGPGIPPEIIGKIWNPFFTGKPRGTGLGLSIALKLLRENLAKIRVQSAVGKGSVFSIELPGAS